jgi:hypothetical protein
MRGLPLLKSLKSLVTLSLTETKLTDSSVETLAGFQSLRSFNFDRSGIRPAGIVQLKKALPESSDLGLTRAGHSRLGSIVTLGGAVSGLSQAVIVAHRTE